MEHLQRSVQVIEEATDEEGKEKINPFVRNLFISGAGLLLIALLMVLWFVFRPNNKTEKHDFFEIEAISELTTLECRYHNVAAYEKEGGFVDIGKQYVWFEYDVIVKVGIDTNQMRIEEPNDDGVVKIYLPPAQILGAEEVESTIFKPVCELGPFTKLTAEEEREIISKGVNKLRDDAKTQEIVKQAIESTREVIRQYVENIGKLKGESYTIEWLKA
ncbi:MAG: DUF4230 domain-containing protein [Oscillospiraceae bacterium]|nr:DUF4230 domain-containing protein [Oscillospiraceae bacterium]